MSLLKACEHKKDDRKDARKDGMVKAIERRDEVGFELLLWRDVRLFPTSRCQLSAVTTTSLALCGDDLQRQRKSFSFDKLKLANAHRNHGACASRKLSRTQRKGY